MKNWIIGVVVLFTALVVTVPASAMWTLVDISDDKNFYIDLKTLRKDANIRRFWTLEDSLKVGDFGQRSEVRREEYDCNLERQRGISLTNREGVLGTGRFINSNNDIQPWSNVAPGTVAETIMRLVCSK